MRKDSGKVRRKNSSKTRLNSIKNSMKRIISNKSMKSGKSSSDHELQTDEEYSDEIDDLIEED